ncbi:MAG: glycosyltransferase family 39 protein [Saprospiraceae bacterium]|jgi:4-amino-4-deoxy-L-arabinose transferase-like glycosyltransferase|nr:glycosyltransferase family 39 protein [Saprospiraceae bacterium]
MRLDYLRIAGLALLFFVPFLGGVHLFDWDEVNFAECAREMMATGDYLRPQIDYEPFWEKPPFFIWLQVLSMKVFGVGEFAARFPNAVAGVLTMLLAYRIGRRLHDNTFGWLWALAWLGSLLPHLYFRSGIIDPWFNLLIFAGLFGFIEFRWLFFTRFEGRTFWRRYRYLLLGGWLLGLAILTKGPTAYLIVLLVLLVYWARYKFRNRGFLTHLLLFSLAAFSVSGVWFLAEVIAHGSGFVQEFLAYQIRLFSTPDSGHGGFFGYHVLVLLLGCFPVSVFALPNLWGDRQPEDEVLESDTLASCQRSDLATWMQILFWVVLILFSIVRTKIVHYSSLAYFPLTYLGVLTIWRAIRWEVRPKVVGILLPILGLLVGGAQMLMPLVGQNPDWLRPFFENDAFALARLAVPVDWQWWHGLPGAVLIGATLAAWWYWQKKQAWQSAQTVFTGGALFVAFTLLLCIRNIERYTQWSTIEFYESKAGHDCYVKPVGFKSYAHLFYTQKPPVQGDCARDDYPTLAEGKSGKKVFFVAKQTNTQELPNLPGCRELFRKDGMVYYERE